ncbi:MAG: GntR family transcriptional regulator [Myxococcota bacterium]
MIPFRSHGMVVIELSDLGRGPFYRQIVEQLEAQILDGHLRAGDVLPPPSALARTLLVSGWTVRRAYAELERRGYVEWPSDDHVIVAFAVRSRHHLQTNSLAEASLVEAIERALSLGISPERLRHLVDTKLTEEAQ